MRRILLLASLLLAAAASVRAQVPSPVNMSVLGRVPLPRSNTTVVAHDQLVFVSHWDFPTGQTVYIYDVDDPASPVLLSEINSPGYGYGDMHSMYYSNGVLYVGYEDGPHALLVHDVSDPTAPSLLSTIDIEDGAHNIRIDGDFLWVARDLPDAYKVFVYDISDPSTPLLVNRLDVGDPSSGWCHDLTLMNGTAWLSMWDEGVLVLDVRDPLSVAVVGGSAMPAADTHSAWPSPDLGTVYTAHEYWDLGVYASDTSTSPWTTLWNYQSHARAASTMVHDVVAIGDFLYIAYYREGYRILDVSDRTSPREVGSFVTDSECLETDLFCSIWAHWIDSGRIYVADTRNGLWILSFDLPHDPRLTLYAVKDPSRTDVDLTWNFTGEHQYKVRRNARRDSVAGSRTVDVDARTRWSDAAAPPDGESWYYRINGPWR